MKNRKGMPTKLAVVKYWVDKLTQTDEYGIKTSLDCYYDGDTKEATKICFACENTDLTERCHIVSVDKGGSNSVDNIHLLCRECHLESENLDNKTLYIEWIKRKDMLNSGSYLRVLNKAKFYVEIFKENKTKIIPKKVLSILKRV